MADNNSLFGWLFNRQPETAEPLTFSPKEIDDGAVVVAAAGAFGTYIDLDGTVRSDAELITRYREMALHPEIDNAVDEVVNAMIAGDEADTVKIVLDDLQQTPVVKKAIEGAFSDVVQLLDFRHHGYDLVRRWYIDGRMYFHAIIDENNTSAGLQEIRYIDPRKIRKIREVIKKRARGGDNITGAAAVLTQVKNEYFIYSDRGLNVGNKIVTSPTSGIKIAKDAIVYITSGLTDSYGSRVLSYLHKAIKPLNQLRTLEDASVIYRLSRSSERRIWYIDIGNLPKMKAEQYVRDIMVKHKNRLTYDATSGEVMDDRKYMTLLEDYWLPTRGSGQGTRVETLPPGTSFNQIDDILFFLKKLYVSLQVPVSRLDPDNTYDPGVATQISRDEVKFGKLITRLRVRFGDLFIKLIEKQVVLKNIMTLEDFQSKCAPFIRFDFVKNNHFLEAEDSQIYQNRMMLATAFVPFLGHYYSHSWLRKNILHQTLEEQEEIDKEIEEELDVLQYQNVTGLPPEEPEPEEEDEGEQGVMADMNQLPNTPPGPPKADAKKSGSSSKKPNDFKSVASILSKKT